MKQDQKSRIHWEQDLTARRARIGDWVARVRGPDDAVEVEIGRLGEPDEDTGERREPWNSEDAGYYLNGVVETSEIAQMIVNAVLLILHDHQK